MLIFDMNVKRNKYFHITSEILIKFYQNNIFSNICTSYIIKYIFYILRINDFPNIVIEI